MLFACVGFRGECLFWVVIGRLCVPQWVFRVGILCRGLFSTDNSGSGFIVYMLLAFVFEFGVDDVATYCILL